MIVLKCWKMTWVAGFPKKAWSLTLKTFTGRRPWSVTSVATLQIKDPCLPTTSNNVACFSRALSVTWSCPRSPWGIITKSSTLVMKKSPANFAAKLFNQSWWNITWKSTSLMKWRSFNAAFAPRVTTHCLDSKDTKIAIQNNRLSTNYHPSRNHRFFMSLFTWLDILNIVEKSPPVLQKQQGWDGGPHLQFPWDRNIHLW